MVRWFGGWVLSWFGGLVAWWCGGMRVSGSNCLVVSWFGAVVVCCCNVVPGLMTRRAALVTLILPKVSVRTLLILLGSASRMIPIVPMAIHWFSAVRTLRVNLTWVSAINSADVENGCARVSVIECIGCVGLTSIDCCDRRNGDRRVGESSRGLSRFLGVSPMLRRVASSRASGSSTPCPCIALVDCLIPGI